MAKKPESNVDFVRVGKGGEVIEIDPSTLDSHKRHGWVEVVGSAPTGTNISVDLPAALSKEVAKKLLDNAAAFLGKEQKAADSTNDSLDQGKAPDTK